MSLYLPIKVFKNDRLPQKVCDRCSCKVNDFYQFCNETIEVQNRLRAVLLSTAVEVEDSIDLTLIKYNDLSPHPTQAVQKVEPIDPPCIPTLEVPIQRKPDETTTQIPQSTSSTEITLVPTQPIRKTCDQTTQTELSSSNTTLPSVEPTPSEINIEVPLYQNIRVKEEPNPVFSQNVKTEDDFAMDDYSYPNLPSDNSEDDMSLMHFKKKKSKKVKVANGNVEKKKRKKNLKEWEMLMRALPEGTALTVVDPPDVKVDVKQELEDLALDAGKMVKQEPVEFHCCVCFVQCYSRAEMLQHYKEHASAMEAVPLPPAPPPPEQEVTKCTRCQKRIDKANWATHWQKHWERDRRPYRCALCEKTFRDHHQILKHGLTHKWGDEGEQNAGPDKRFVCDLCPEGFVYMRYLLAHRARAHPEAAARALTLRCAVCKRQFAHLNSLRRHLRAHTGERNFLCNICGKALSSREHLKFHIRIHTGYKPNICKTCGKGFVKKCNLTLHERVHSGERPHVCPHCGKAFSQRSTLVIHER
ncbi:zinc-finger double domain-containing protein [Phthorimaea operculella]|nr:zinc-finger double domain-containing protein [Phthorimaea operculella]